MTINDNTIPVFYGLPYQSDVSGNSSRKIREFSRGGLYPQLTVSLSGGVNVFNAFKEYAKEPGFISTNPYLGLKATYQINTLWILGAQLNAIQRGGVNQQIHYLENPENDIMLKQFYAVQLPFSVGYFLNKKNSVSLGVAPMYTLATKFSTYDLANQQLKKSTQFLNTKGLNVFDLQLSAGYTYRLNKKVNLHASYYFGLIDATKSNTFTNDLRHTNHFLNIGINYNLLQKKVNLR
jgi:hypothetical protein